MTDDDTKLLARLLTYGQAARSPEYWDAFMQRAREPIGLLGMRYGDFVPGLNSYMATTDLRSAVDAGDYKGALKNAALISASLMPGGRAPLGLGRMARVADGEKRWATAEAINDALWGANAMSNLYDNVTTKKPQQ